VSDSVSLDEGDTPSEFHATFIPKACICSWERKADHWEMVRLVPHCVMHLHLLRRDRPN
jgi:hypothetical protein